AGATMSELPHAEDRAQLFVGEHGAVAANEDRAELAMTAQADGAFHVALHGDVHGVRRYACGSKRRDRESHHHLRSADQGDGVRGIECSARDERRDDADATAPVASGMIDGDRNIDIEPAAPALELVLEQDIVGLPHAHEEDDAAETGTLGEE